MSFTREILLEDKLWCCQDESEIRYWSRW